jgi:hypothetical protein
MSCVLPCKLEERASCRTALPRYTACTAYRRPSGLVLFLRASCRDRATSSLQAFRELFLCQILQVSFCFLYVAPSNAPKERRESALADSV